MELRYTARAFKEIAKLPRAEAQRLAAELKKIAAEPFAHHRNASRMEGEPPSYRLRVGDYRAVYSIDRETGTVPVTRVGNRKEIYR